MPDTKTQVNQEEPTGGGDIGIIIGQICANLGIDPGEDLASTLRAIQEATKKGGGEEGESDAEEVAAKMRTALGLTVDATAETIVAEVNKLRGHIGYVKADEYKAVTKRLESLEQANAAREAEGLVATYIETGKLNPNDEERMKWAREQAVTNTEAFKTLMDGAPVIGPPQGKTTPPTGSAAGAGGRAAIIANSAREYDGMDTAYQVMTNKAAFVGGDLRKAGLKPLTAEETKALEG